MRFGHTLPFPVPFRTTRLAPGEAYTAATDRDPLHVIDDMLGADALRESNEGTAPARRGRHSLDLASAGKGLPQNLFGDRLVDASDEDGCVAGIRSVCSGLPCVKGPSSAVNHTEYIVVPNI